MSTEKQPKMSNEQESPENQEQRVSTEKQDQKKLSDKPGASAPKSGNGAYTITVPVRDLPDKERKMSVKSADEHEREALPDKGVPSDFIWCIGILAILAIIFIAVAAVMFNVAKTNGILDLTRETYEL